MSAPTTADLDRLCSAKQEAWEKHEAKPTAATMARIKRTEAAYRAAVVAARLAQQTAETQPLTAKTTP
jgi:hypothetical protein